MDLDQGYLTGQVAFPKDPASSLVRLPARLSQLLETKRNQHGLVHRILSGGTLSAKQCYVFSFCVFCGTIPEQIGALAHV